MAVQYFPQGTTQEAMKTALISIQAERRKQNREYLRKYRAAKRLREAVKPSEGTEE